MRNPQDPQFQKIQQLLMSGQMTGEDRPVGRVTFAKQSLHQVPARAGVGTVRYLPKEPVETELLSISTIDIDRSIGQDSATCTISLWNVRPDSTQPEGVDASGTTGYLTPTRGQPLPVAKSVFTTGGFSDDLNPATDDSFPTDWGYATNLYKDVLIPNTVLRTYQGYGSDNFDGYGNPRDPSDVDYIAPKDDTRLYQTGVWLIDTVTFGADGTITVECRDLAKFLIEQYIYPPMIPVDRFPLIYCPAHGATGHKESIGRNVAKFHSSSVDSVAGTNAKVYGHRGSDAFDARPGSYWLSGGSASADGLEWIQAEVKGPINEIVLDTWKGNYVVYVSIHEGGAWQGIDEVQHIIVGGSPIGGSFTLTFDGQTTDPINFNAKASTVQSALSALSNIGHHTATLQDGSTVKRDNVLVTGSRGGPYNVRFVRKLRAQNVAQISGDASGLDGNGVTPSIVVSTITEGSSPTLEGNVENLGYFDSPGSNGDGELDQGFFYVISSGDTLWDLAGTYYGDNLKWPIIAHANANIIKDPHWIYPGQRIKIPYVPGTTSPPPGGAGSDATGSTKLKIPYVSRHAVPKSGKVTIHLPHTYNARFVRVAFKSLQKFTPADDFRAGVRTMIVRNHVLNTYHPATIGKAGYIQDWTQPIKELCAWAGLTWEDATPNAADPVLGASRDGKPLRVWGDFETLGAGPIVCTPADYFLSKSFMDGIRQISDFIGGVFFIDETGGAQFRLPNIWNGGNFINDTSALSTLGARISQHPIEFHENANITSYQALVTDASVRSEILVIGGYPGVNSKGPVAGGYVLGYNPATHSTSAIDFTDVLAGQYRLMVVPGDSTKLFYTELECQRMAELTALFILFTYRQGTLNAPAHPGLQLDDQIRIYERVSYEGYIHYVSAIRTHQDLQSGAYTMEVSTHWLGNDPDTDWFVNKQQLTPAVKELPAILKRVGKQAGGDVFEQPIYGV